MSGRPDYDVGDLVVCVQADPFKCAGGCMHTGKRARLGRIHRVAGFESARIEWGSCIGDPCGCQNVIFEDGQDANASRFRKVDPLPDALTSLLASKPVRESIPA